MLQELDHLYTRARQESTPRREPEEEQIGAFLTEYVAVVDLPPKLKEVVALTRPSKESWATVEFAHFAAHDIFPKPWYAMSIRWTINVGARENHGVNELMMHIKEKNDQELELRSEASNSDILRHARGDFSINSVLSGDDPEGLATLDPIMVEEYRKIEALLKEPGVKEEILGELISLFNRPGFAEDGPHLNSSVSNAGH
jgi:hypothetical protein